MSATHHYTKTLLVLVLAIVSLLQTALITEEEKFGDGIRTYSQSVIDWSNECVNGSELSEFLTYGMGLTDALVAFISEDGEPPHCTVNLYSYKEVYIILVIEIPNRLNGKMACNSTNVLVNITERESAFDACLEIDRGDSYSTTIVTQESRVTVFISGNGTFDSVKLIATTGRLLGKNEKCKDESEVYCKVKSVDGLLFDTCISRELLCDGNNNCGTQNNNDEDERICPEGEHESMWELIAVLTMTVVLVICLVVRLLWSCVPRIPDSFFVFNEHEDNKLNLAAVQPLPSTSQMSLYRVASSISSYKLRRSFVVSSNTGSVGDNAAEDEEQEVEAPTVVVAFHRAQNTDSEAEEEHEVEENRDQRKPSGLRFVSEPIEIGTSRFVHHMTPEGACKTATRPILVQKRFPESSRQKDDAEGEDIPDPKFTEQRREQTPATVKSPPQVARRKLKRSQLSLALNAETSSESD